MRGRVIEDNSRARENGQEWSKAVNELDPYTLPGGMSTLHIQTNLQGHIYILLFHFIMKAKERGEEEGEGERGTSPVNETCTYVFQHIVKCTSQT